MLSSASKLECFNWRPSYWKSYLRWKPSLFLLEHFLQDSATTYSRGIKHYLLLIEMFQKSRAYNLVRIGQIPNAGLNKQSSRSKNLTIIIDGWTHPWCFNVQLLQPKSVDSQLSYECNLGICGHVCSNIVAIHPVYPPISRATSAVIVSLISATQNRNVH